MAAASSLRSRTLLMPTDDPRLAGFTNTGYCSFSSIILVHLRGFAFHSPRSSVTCFTMGKPAIANIFFMASLSMPTDEPSTPDPT